MELYYLLRNDTRLMIGLKLPLVRSSVNFSFNGKKYVEKKEKKKKKRSKRGKGNLLGSNSLQIFVFEDVFNFYHFQTKTVIWTLPKERLQV